MGNNNVDIIFDEIHTINEIKCSGCGEMDVVENLDGMEAADYLYYSGGWRTGWDDEIEEYVPYCPKCSEEKNLK